jgi:ATP phosphoribosyltransferase
MAKIALPTGDLREPAAALLAEAGLPNLEYASGSRSLRLTLECAGDAALRVFRERDIPIQIALGNYDIGICGLASIEELRLRFPQDEIVMLRPLPFGNVEVHLATDPETARCLGPMQTWPEHIGLRIVSDLPTIAESFALSARLPRARVTAVLGSADAYPPEDAELAVLQASSAASVEQRGLVSMATLLTGSAWLIANRRSLAYQDLSAVLGPLLRLPPSSTHGFGLNLPRLRSALQAAPWHGWQRDAAVLRLALPDGHQQRHTYESLKEAGFCFDGYTEKTYVRRPKSGIPGLDVKVIRPQDMPEQVALGKFDLAMTGRDVLRDHLLAFPDSPVEEAVDLGRSGYGIAAVVDEGLPATTIREALDFWRRSGRKSIRIASEYPNIADNYARTHHFGRYRVMPIAGASEAFVPEDAEVLIEGSETGKSIVANKLKIIDSLFESTNCMIAGRRPLAEPRRALSQQIIAAFRRAVAMSAEGQS